MRQSIKQALCHYLQQKSLSGKQVKQLQQLQNQTDQNKPGYKTTWLMAMSIAATLILSVLIFYNLVLQPNKNNMPLLIAEEVVSNHLKLKPLEIKANRLKDINQYFSMLDFVPIRPNRLPDFSEKLLGGRYCSLQGVTAAQFRLQDTDNGEIQTLYETIYNPKIFSYLPNLEKGEAPIIVYVKGVQVEIWVEKGLLFAQTHQVQND